MKKTSDNPRKKNFNSIASVNLWLKILPLVFGPVVLRRLETSAILRREL